MSEQQAVDWEPREPLMCELCGQVDADVSPGLGWYLDAEPGAQVQRIDRCKDALRCRDRVQKADSTWPLLERAP